MSKAFFVSVISALGMLMLLNFFGVIGFVVLIIIGGTLMVLPKNESLAVSTKNELLAARFSRDAKHLPLRICVKKQKDDSGVQQI
jgi:hypothetical protein